MKGNVKDDRPPPDASTPISITNANADYKGDHEGNFGGNCLRHARHAPSGYFGTIIGTP